MVFYWDYHFPGQLSSFERSSRLFVVQDQMPRTLSRAQSYDVLSSMVPGFWIFRPWGPWGYPHSWMVYHLVGGFKKTYVPFHIWDVIPTPLTNSIIFQDGYCTTNQSWKIIQTTWMSLGYTPASLGNLHIFNDMIYDKTWDT